MWNIRWRWEILERSACNKALTHATSRQISPLTRLTSPFIEVDELEHRFDRARRQADLRQTLIQSLRASIAPAAFRHERIPDFNFLLARVTPIFKNPRE